MKNTSQNRRNTISRSRRAIIWIFFSIIGLNCSLAVLIDQCVPTFRDPDFVQLANNLSARRQEAPNSQLVLFLGSSRIALGVDAKELQTEETLAFNFGMPGAGPLMMDIYWDRLQEMSIRPDMVVIEFMHPFYNAANGRTLDHSFLDGSRLSIDESQRLLGYGNRSTGAFRRWFVSRMFPASKHGREILDSIGSDCLTTSATREGTPPRPDAFGYRPLAISVDKVSDMTTLAHRQYDVFYPEFQLASDPYNRFTNLIQKIQRTGAVVKVLVTPEGSEFRELASSEMKQKLEELFKEIAQKNRLEVIDARRWFPDDAFYDQHHLFPKSGIRFAELLRPHIRFHDEGLLTSR